MSALWNVLFTADGYALYVWAAVIGVLVFVMAELLLLNLRCRSIMEYLGRSRHESPPKDDIKTHIADANEQR